MQAKVYRNGILTNELPYNSEAEIAHFEKCKSLRLFGKPERQVEVVPAVLDEQGNVISPAQYETLPAEYEIQFVDNSALLQQEADNAEAIQFLADTDWKVLRHRDQQELGIATSLTAEEFQDLLQQRQMAREAIIK
jgi:hypothetical protein